MGESNLYRVTGQSRQAGAIGRVESFVEYIQAETAKQAYEQARDKQYANNRELVHILKIDRDTGNDDENYVWAIVEPMAYLYQ